MRLRHKKWADRVLQENTDVGKDLSSFDPQSVKNYQRLEIGSGCGGFLIDRAKKQPDKTFLGVEINQTAFAIAVKKAASAKEEAKNFTFLNSPIERIFPLIGDGQLEAIFINFPDPWPKKRQRKRRLSYPDRLKEYFRRLKPGGKIYFRTDNTSLFEDSVEYFKSVSLYSIDVIEPFESEKQEVLSPTEYENKFRAKGVRIHLLVAEKTAK